MRRAPALLFAFLLCATVAGAGGQAGERPARVVSMNLCTDQLAILVAHPGQLHSVSWLAADPSASVLWQEARQFSLNHGLAEEIFLMKPDVVIAGTFTTRATVTLLRRLGIRVEEFAPVSNFDDIEDNMTRMGAILGNEPKAHELVTQFRSELRQRMANPQSGKRLALFYANSYTSGSGTLADAIVEASRLRNIGREMGYSGTVKLPLELLVTAEPDLVAGREGDYSYPAKAQENFAHPAYRAVTQGGRGIAMESRYWICGAPFTLQAARDLAARAGSGDDE